VLQAVLKTPGGKVKPYRSNTTPPRGPEKLAPLSDQRFQDLLNAAGSFFASFESDPAAEKAAAIAEIQDLMSRYGLAVEDLLDQSC
jgi:hypothetical protein